MDYVKVVMEVVVPKEEAEMLKILMLKSYVGKAGILTLKAGEVEELTEQELDTVKEAFKYD